MNRVPVILISSVLLAGCSSKNREEITWSEIASRNSLVMCEKYNIEFNGNIVMWPNLANVRQFNPPASHGNYDRKPYFWHVSGNRLDLITNREPSSIAASYELLSSTGNHVVLKELNSGNISKCKIQS